METRCQEAATQRERELERERESERGECATRLEAKGKHKTDVFQGKAKGGCAEDGLWQAKAQQ